MGSFLTPSYPLGRSENAPGKLSSAFLRSVLGMTQEGLARKFLGALYNRGSVLPGLMGDKEKNGPFGKL